MMSSLIGQLLMQGEYKGFEFGLSGIDDRRHHKLRTIVWQTLCILFSDLITQLLRDNFVCRVIDATSLYEASEEEDDILYVWEKLNRLTNKIL